MKAQDMGNCDCDSFRQDLQAVRYFYDSLPEKRSIGWAAKVILERVQGFTAGQRQVVG